MIAAQAAHDFMNLLVIEDEPKLARLLKQMLEEERYRVDVARDGARGLELAETGRYDAIILDVLLPKRDGLNVCRWLRQHQVRTPVLMLTALGQVHEKVAGLDAGADDYLSKPFAFEELLARVRAMTRRDANGQVADRLEAGDLSLDRKTREVRRAGRRLELTAREFALLEFLMRHPNQVLTQAQIAEHVWDMNYDGMTNRVAVYISYLRGKVDDGFAVKRIRTVYGVGYKLVGDA
jgi:DNA-binding response OmpR family regulator